MTIRSIDHVQLAMPLGGEAAARAFYGGLLGIPERPKPAELAARGGCWFECGGLRVHLGAEGDFRAARKAHPAFVVDDLPRLVASLRDAGCTLREDDPIDGRARAFVDDPFGNRIELMEPERSG
ncbi:MAG TPA: VOC family protein [Rudaea sp.]|nr:VOC family protein [Rudaea sp.]